MWYCVFTSLLFLFNGLVSFIHKYYVGAILWVSLSITSTIYHSARTLHYLLYPDAFVLKETIMRFIVANSTIQNILMFDKFFLWTALFYTIFTFYSKIYNVKWGIRTHIVNISVLTLLYSMVVIYYYGKLTNQYCFNPIAELAESWHGILHILGSLGNIITFLV
jgi:hypothetical protein